MEKTYIKGFVTKSADGKTYKVLASTASVDRQGDSISQDGWDLTNFKNNPVMPWAHDYSLLPIAKVTEIGVTDKGLEAEFEFAPVEGNPMAQQVKVLYDEGYLNAVSVGFIPKTKSGNTIKTAELLEISFVPVPANQDALRLAFKSIEDNASLSLLEKSTIKGVLEKGEVADELDAEEAWQAKWENWCAFSDIISALWTVYFDQTTPVEDFGSLLTEAMTLMQPLADGTTAAEDTEKGMVAKAISAEAVKNFVDFVSKSGRTLSKKTLGVLDTSIENMKATLAALEDLKTQNEKDEAEEVDAAEGKTDDAEVKILSHEEIVDMLQVRKSAIVTKQGSELTISLVNNLLKKQSVEE